MTMAINNGIKAPCKAAIATKSLRRILAKIAAFKTIILVKAELK